MPTTTESRDTTDTKIETLNATGAGGVTIERTRYDPMREALLRVIPRDHEGVPFKELKHLAAPLLPDLGFPKGSSVSWHVTVVKLDLEARGLIERVPGSRPQRVRRT